MLESFAIRSVELRKKNMITNISKQFQETTLGGHTYHGD